MKNIFLILFSVLITLLSFACRKDVFTDVNNGVEPIDGGTVTIVETNLTGLVLDSEKQPIADAEILIAGQTAITDENGVYRFTNIDLSSGGSLLNIIKEGYFDGFQFVSGLPGQNSYQEAILVEKEAQVFDSQVGRILTINGGSSITFQPNTIVDSDGENYQGEVLVSAHWYDPSTEETIHTMPGDLRGINLEAQMVQLLSHGMMAVELMSPSGEELQLQTGSTATLKFPIPNGFNTANYSTIPTWHLDELTGLWIEEGEAVVGDDFLTAEVAHFSFWNCDVPFPLVNITGTLVTETGLPIANQLIVIKDENNNISQSGYTNESGFFSGKVPEGVDLTMSTFHCNQDFFLLAIGNLTNDQDLGDISVNSIGSSTISGALEDCAFQAITNGYLKLITNTGTTIISPDNDGNFSYNYFDCEEMEGTIIGYDLTEMKTSDAIIFDINQPIIDLGAITVCENIADEFVSIFIDDKALVINFEDLDVILADNEILYIWVYAENDSSGLAPTSLLIKYDLNQNIAQYVCGGYDLNQDWIATDGEGLTMNVSPFTNVGELITISFDNGEFRGNFQLFLDKIVTSGVVQGKIWMDENENGIRDVGELPIAGKELTIRPALGYSSSYYPMELGDNFSAVSDIDGNFTFSGIIVGEEHDIYYFKEIGEEISPANLGSDDSIDSDFISGSSSNPDFFKSGFFLVEEGGDYTNFGLGIKL